MPHQKAGLADGTTCDLGTFPSAYGTLSVCRGDTLKWSEPTRAVTTQLDLGKLSNADKATLAEQVRKDVAETKDFPADTYFGGKALYRVGQALPAGHPAGARPDVGDAAQGEARHRAARPVDRPDRAARSAHAFCFVYDEQAKGMVGLTPSFGSDEFNDHHFHYGYFLYAAGVLAAGRPGPGQASAQPVMDLRRGRHRRAAPATGCSPTAGSSTPTPATRGPRGTSPFADGNNQESQLRGGHRLDRAGDLGQDATATSRWRPRPPGCCPPRQQTALALLDALRQRATRSTRASGTRSCPLNWGGKRDYATWFSPEPAAMLGILCIPMSPASAPTSAATPTGSGQRRRGDRRAVRRRSSATTCSCTPPWPATSRTQAARWTEASSLDDEVDRRRQQPRLPARLADDQGVVAPPGALTRARHPFRVAGPVCLTTG